MSHLEAIKVAVKDPMDKPDLVTALAAIGTAGLVVNRFLWDADTHAWHVPTKPFELWVLGFAIASGIGAFLKFIKAFKPRASTKLALKHLDDLYAQHNITDDPMTCWQKIATFVWRIL